MANSARVSSVFGPGKYHQVRCLEHVVLILQQERAHLRVRPDHEVRKARHHIDGKIRIRIETPDRAISAAVWKRHQQVRRAVCVPGLACIVSTSLLHNPTMAHCGRVPRAFISCLLTISFIATAALLSISARASWKSTQWLSRQPAPRHPSNGNHAPET